MNAGGASFDSRRERYLFNYCSYLGGESYRRPPPTTLSTASVSTYALNADGTRVESTPRTFHTFLVPHAAESDKSFEARLALAAGVPVAEIIVDAYAEGVTSAVTRQLGAIEDICQDVDLKENTWAEFAEDAARWFCVYGSGATVVDAPPKDADVVTRADEKARGTRPYAIFVHPSAYAWVNVDEFGRTKAFAYVDRPYEDDVIGAGTTQVVTVREYCAAETDAETGKKTPGKWRVLRGAIRLGQSISAQRGQFADVIAEGELDAVLNGRIPVVFGYYRRDSSTPYPVGLSLIDSACDLQRVIYNKRSWEQQIARLAGFPMLTIPMAGTGGQMDPGAARVVGEGKALSFDSNAGSPQWIQPSAEWAKDLRDSCMGDFQLALRSAGLELAADASAQVQSGDALRIRSRDYESRAKRFARHMARWEAAVLRLIALLAGENDTGITIEYPKRFTLPDLSADLDRALTLVNPSKMPIEIGRTAKLAAAMQAINSAIVLNDDMQKQVRVEVEAILKEDEADIAQQRAASAAQRDAMVAQFAKKSASNDTGDPNSEGADAEGDKNAPPPDAAA
jgi:hypothetical protein